MQHDEEKERTLVAILNEGEIPFERIIAKSDNAFKLKHVILQERSKEIVLFKVFEPTGIAYKMFIYCKVDGVVEEIKYTNMENTWSVYNTLSQTLLNQYFINQHQKQIRKYGKK